MKSARISVTPGDGISYEVMDSVLACMDKAKKYYGSEISLEYVHENIGFDLFEETGASMIIEGVTFGGITQKSLDVFDTTDAMIYIATSGGDFPRGIYTPFPVVRRHFGIFANVRPSKTLPNVYSLKPDIDLVLVREQTEGLWMGHEEEVAPGEIIAQVKITTAASEKIGRFACELAMQRNGKKLVTAVHKDNVLNLAFGTFKDCVAKAAAEYPEITFEDMHTDVLPYQLIKDPEHFDVIVTTNMYGDAISGETTGICGGLGVGPSGEYGDNWAVFRSVHGSAPKYKGMDRVDPVAGILSACMMMDFLAGRKQAPTLKIAADRIRDAVNKVLAEGTHVTRDLGGSAGTKEMTTAILENI
jgi:isocitrate/isopropylmalate dehydrogenase